MKYIPYDKMSISDLEALVDKTLAHWQDLYENGGNDPCWPDGTNLNLVRNHIIYYQGLIRAKKAEPEQLSFFSVMENENSNPKLPPKVPDSYMAHPERIREAAKATLAAMSEAGIPIQNLCGLKQAIEQDALISMRRFRDTAYWLERLSA